ncbi:MAG TPA: BamA/TamA family outer membrane protein [Elusimicrobiota bacterium]|nr:BamA/TamA family outer membrane protein [Elusimicrobiota bacterium]
MHALPPQIPASVIALLLLFAPVAGLHADDAPPAGGARIRKIHIWHKDIFDTAKPTENHFPYRLVNALHISTKNTAIKRELLLREGDVYNPQLKKESEIALRKILRLRKAKITTIPIDKNQVDLWVEVQETWSTEPILSFSGVGDRLSGKAGIKERNFLGWGKDANFLYKKSMGRITRSYSYTDPNLWGSRLRLEVDYDERDEGLGKHFLVERPYYASITPWAGSANYRSNEEENRVFDNGNEVDRIFHENHDMSVSHSHSFGSTTRRIRRVGVGYQRIEDRQSRTSPIRTVLKDKNYDIANLKIHLERIKYLTADHINLYDRDEDYELGPSLSLTAGRSDKWGKTSEPATFLKIDTFAGQSHGVSRFTLATGKLDGRYEDGDWRDTHARLDVSHYNHFEPRQTIVAHFRAEHLTNPDPSSQILLGGDRGLRGYQINQFAGNKLLLGNLENRFFLVDDLWAVVGLGSVIFIDAGYVWDMNQVINFRDLKTDVGAGLRFHISRSSFGNVLRLDVAYAVNRVPGESRVVITFGSSQAF